VNKIAGEPAVTGGPLSAKQQMVQNIARQMGNR
jgi:hypothetical protein